MSSLSSSTSEQEQPRLKAVGVVRSPIASPREMPRGGVSAIIEVFPEYEEGLASIEESTHIMVIGWFHEAARDAVFLERTGHPSQPGPPRGVFATRSPSRPNPLGVSSVPLRRREGNKLFVDHLDMIDGTPIVDIKTYSPTFDCLFAARSPRHLLKDQNNDPDYSGLLYEAESFHGERCVGIALAAKALVHARRVLGVAQKDPELVVTLGQDGCIADGLQALTGASFGNGRLRVGRGRGFSLARGAHRLIFTPQPVPGKGPDEILEEEAIRWFRIQERRG